MMSNDNSEQALGRIISVMQKLRDPINGCPWDRQQTWHSLVSYTLEEAYEVVDAIENPEHDNVIGELGDLLFHVVFYAAIAEEQNLFDLQGVIHRLCDKLEQRHPHVFSDATVTEEQLEQAWHKTKSAERKAKHKYSALDDIPLALPALSRAQKLQRRAANEGMDWRSYTAVFEKIDEEISELKQAVLSNDIDEIQDEMGDVFFTLVNLARHLNVDAETCLRQASRKFEKRYRAVEAHYLQRQQKISDISDPELEATWEAVKQKHKQEASCKTM